MKLKFIKHFSIKENDSDYDTAVDISHYHSENHEYQFETEHGAIVTFQYNLQSSSSSYLEPDFDEPSNLPVGGYGIDQQGNEFSYKTHLNNDHNSQSSYHISLINTLKNHEFTVEEFEIYINEFENNEHNGYLSYVNSHELKNKYGMDDEIIYQLNIYHAQHSQFDSYYETNEHCKFPICTKEELASVIDNFTIFKKSEIYEIILPLSLEKQLIELDQLNHTIIEHNSHVIPVNKLHYEQAKHNLHFNRIEQETLRNIADAEEEENLCHVSLTEKSNLDILQDTNMILKNNSVEETLVKKLFNTIKRKFR